MILWVYSYLRTLMSVLSIKVSCFTEVWHIMHFFAGTLIWYHKQTHTKRHTALSMASRLLCAHSRYLYNPEWIIHWYLKFIFHNVFSVQKSFNCTSYICLLDAIRLDFSCETQKILIEMVYISKTHTHTQQTLIEK